MASVAELTSMQALRVGGVEIRPDTREVVGSDSTEILEPRVMQVLVLLAQADGAVVTRDELVRRCWDGRIVSDDAVSRVVQRLRRVAERLGGFSIRTVHKAGYRLVQAEQAVPAEKPAEEPASGEKQQPQEGLSRRVLLGAAVTVGLALAGLSRRPRPDTVETLIRQAEDGQRRALPDAAAQGIAPLEQAVALEPDNARAWGLLALARAHAAEYAASDQVSQLAEGSIAAAERARSLDPKQADALCAMAVLPSPFGAWLQTEVRLRSILKAEPAHRATRDALASLLGSVGRCREASVDRLRLADEDPLHLGYQYKLIYAHWTRGDIAAADRAAERALHLAPAHPAAWFGRLWLNAFTGRPERALTALQDGRPRPALPPESLGLLRGTMKALGGRREADIASVARAWAAQVSRSPGASINGIMVLSQLGRLDDAFAIADAYLLERGPLLAELRWARGERPLNDQRRRKTQMLFIPPCLPLRADHRFASLMRDIGMAEYWKASAPPDYLSRAS